MGRVWRVYDPELPEEPREAITVVGPEAHHVARVLRLEAGERLTVFDGRGREWTATLLSVDRERITLEPGEPLTDPVEAPLSLAIYQSVCRTERLEWMVQKATELGVASISLLPAERSPNRPPRMERLRRIAVEAAKQSGRRRVPEVELVAELPHLESDADWGAVLSPTAPALEARWPVAGPRLASILVGPESGLAAAEVAAAADRGWIPVSVGPRILRAETAGIVVASLLLHRWGDLGRQVVDLSRPGS